MTLPQAKQTIEWEIVWIETRDETTFVVWHSGTAIKCYGSLSQAQEYVDSL